MKAENIVGMFDAAAAAAPDISVTSPTEVSGQQPTAGLQFTLLSNFSRFLYFTLLYFTFLLCTLLYWSVLYGTLVFSTRLYSSLHCSTLLLYTLLCWSVLYSSILKSTLLYLSTQVYSAVLNSTALYSLLLDSSVLYSTLPDSICSALPPPCLPSFLAFTGAASIESSYSLLSVWQSGCEQPAGHGPGLFQCLNQSLFSHTGGWFMAWTPSSYRCLPPALCRAS